MSLYKNLQVGQMYKARYTDKYIVITDRRTSRSSFRYVYINNPELIHECPFNQSDIFDQIWELVVKNDQRTT